MATETVTRFLVPGEYSAWSELVDNSPDGSVYSLPEYLEVLCSVAGGSFRILAAERDGKLVGGIALYERESRFGSHVSTRRLLYYNGIVLEPHDSKYPSHRTSWQLHTLTALEQAMARLPHARVRFKSRSTLIDQRVFLSPRWSLQPTYTYVVDISDLEAAWVLVDKNQRRLIRRCREQGVAVTMNEDIDSFYRLHVRTHKRTGGPVYLPRDAFCSFIEQLQRRSLCRLYHARLPDGRAIASQLVLAGKHPVAHTVCCGSDEEFLSLGASPFLRWNVLQDLAGSGYLANDLTDAELNSATYFKSQLGGELNLCLEVTRSDHLSWRLGEFAQTASMRVKRGLLRLVRPSSHGSRS